MKLTKYEHACFVLDQEGSKLVVDPGIFSNLPEDMSQVVVIVITHEHADHYDQNTIDRIVAGNPDVVIYAAFEIKGAISPDIGRTYSAGPFELMFYGGEHEAIRAGVPTPRNLGVNINQLVSYPGDSFADDSLPSKALLAPAAAPWLKISEACDFIESSSATLVIPTHDAVLSEAGLQIHDNHLRAVSEATGKQYRRLSNGEVVEI